MLRFQLETIRGLVVACVTCTRGAENHRRSCSCRCRLIKKNHPLVTYFHFVSSVDKKLACVVSYGSSGQQEEELQSIACYFLFVGVVVCFCFFLDA